MLWVAEGGDEADVGNVSYSRAELPGVGSEPGFESVFQSVAVRVVVEVLVSNGETKAADPVDKGIGGRWDGSSEPDVVPLGLSSGRAERNAQGLPGFRCRGGEARCFRRPNALRCHLGSLGAADGCAEPKRAAIQTERPGVLVERWGRGDIDR